MREIHGSGGLKKFILRAKTAPEVDCARIGDALLPIQTARPQQGGRVIFRVFAGESQRERKRQPDNVRRTRVTDDLAVAMDVIRNEGLRRRIGMPEGNGKRHKAD